MTFAKTSPALAQLISDIGERKKDVTYSCGVVGDDFVFGPGKLTVVGAPPATGKTALASQIVFDALVENPDLRLWVANCEMDITSLLRREIARQSGVAHKRILTATFDDDEREQIFEAATAMAAVAARCRHMMPPFDVESLGALLLQEPGILVVDYLQKFRSAEREARTGVDQVVTVLRGLALEGWAILAMSSTTRQQGGKGGGHNHANLSMSSFKESGEIEFNADAAYLLRDCDPESKSKVRDIDLDCVKNRSGSLHTIELRFCGDFMRFEARAPERHNEFDRWNEPAEMPF